MTKTVSIEKIGRNLVIAEPIGHDEIKLSKSQVATNGLEFSICWQGIHFAFRVLAVLPLGATVAEILAAKNAAVSGGRC